MKKTWLGMALALVGGAILGIVLDKLELPMGLLGLTGYAMALIGIVLIMKGGME